MLYFIIFPCLALLLLLKYSSLLIIFHCLPYIVLHKCACSRSFRACISIIAGLRCILYNRFVPSSHIIFVFYIPCLSLCIKYFYFVWILSGHTLYFSYILTIPDSFVGTDLFSSVVINLSTGLWQLSITRVLISSFVVYVKSFLVPLCKSRLGSLFCFYPLFGLILNKRLLVCVP